MAYTKTNWVNDQTELSAENFNHMENGIENSYNVSLLAVSDTAPSECSEGDKYYNTEDNLIYTATGTDTWGTTGTTPISDILYVVLEEQKSYTYDGTTLVSVGGGAGGEALPVGTEVDFDGSVSDIPIGWEQVETYSTYEVKTGDTWIDGKPIYRKVVYISSFPNTALANYPHNISNIDNVVTLKAVAKSSANTIYPLPFMGTSLMFGTGLYVNFRINMTDIQIETASDLSSHTAYVVIEYTKTTD